MTKFHIAKSPHQFGMRWSVLEQNGQITLDEICRCPSMANASLICDALNHAAKDQKTWAKMLGKASTSYTVVTAQAFSSRTRTARPGAGSAKSTPDGKPAM